VEPGAGRGRPRFMDGRPRVTGHPAVRRSGLALLCAAIVLGPILLAACGSDHASASGAAAPAAPASAPPVSALSVSAPPVSALSASAPPGSGSSPTATGSAPSSQAALCRGSEAVTGLDIVRDHGPRVPQQPQIAFPNQVTVSSPDSARSVARAVCALPSMPHGVINCPALFPWTTYQLRFTVDGRPLPAVTIEATGCEAVTGAGPVRRADTSPGFWRVLAMAGDVTPPGRSAFSGRQPT